MAQLQDELGVERTGRLAVSREQIDDVESARSSGCDKIGLERRATSLA